MAVERHVIPMVTWEFLSNTPNHPVGDLIGEFVAEFDEVDWDKGRVGLDDSKKQRGEEGDGIAELNHDSLAAEGRRRPPYLFRA